MATLQQQQNAISFFSKRTDEEIVERLEFFEGVINKAAKPGRKKVYVNPKDSMMVDLLYAVLDRRGYFDGE